MERRSAAFQTGWQAQRIFVGVVALLGWLICLSVLFSALTARTWPPLDSSLACFVILPSASFWFSRFALRSNTPPQAHHKQHA